MSKHQHSSEPPQHAPAARILIVASDSRCVRRLLDTLRNARLGFSHLEDDARALDVLERGSFELVIDGFTKNFADAGPWFESVSELELPLLALDGEDTARPHGWQNEHIFGHIGANMDGPGILDAVESALRAARFSSLRRAATPVRVSDELLEQSSSMRTVMSLLHRVAPTAATVMIRGESGTGKEVIARRLHDLSPRAKAPLIKVHCAALPEQILESELFGYERGAFTGAHARKPGRVELAEGGTLFLDEIGEITMSVQVKLLRLLQDRQYERLGGTKTLNADVRFVTATHRNLEKMVKSGAFREDLYYRLNVVRIDIPSLRERRDDIEPLARHFCRTVNQQTGRGVTINPDAMARIMHADWRGNVRELQNFIERLVVLSESSSVTEAEVKREQQRALDLVDVEEPKAESSVISLDAALRRAERSALEKALRKAKGNRALAARILRVSRRTFFYKLREHDIT